VDGLLRYAGQRHNVELVGFINGLDGLFKEKIMPIEESTFKAFRNLGGYDYLGKSGDMLRTED
jgi:6-phosphofructokinase